MRSFLKRAAALVLSAGLLCSTALASDAMGSRLYGYTLEIGAGTTLTREVMWSASRSDLRTENYVAYTPSSDVSPKVSYGSSVLTKQTVSSMAKGLEQTGDRVLSGVNGDYFVMATGNPLGLVVTDGVLRSSASYLSALGFRPDGTAVIGKPDLTLRTDMKGHSLKIADINKIRSGDGYYLFTSDFGPNTRNTKPGVDVILTPTGENPGQTVTGADGTTALTASDQLGIGRIVPCTVDQVIEATGATSIPAGKYVLSISATEGEWLQEVVRSLQPGDSVNIEIFSADTRWNTVDCAIGAMYQILSGGKVVQGISDGAAAPRTAVGVKPDGQVLFYTMDGRQPGLSVGATISMVASRLAELGCTDAVLLDGGGSTTLVSTYPDRNTAGIVNSPSEGKPRSVTNALFLVSNLDATGVPGSLYVTPASLTLLGGASTNLSVTGVDTGWYPLKDLPGEITWSADQGTVSADGVFIAPRQSGTYTVTAASGTVTGSTRIQVFDTPDSIRLTNKATGKTVSSLHLTPGQTVDIDASATYRTLKLTGDDSCYTWSVTGWVGKITPDGKLTAGPNTASGKLTISAGNHSAAINVSVSAPDRFTCLIDFEGNAVPFTSSQARLTLTDEAAYVKYGRRSLQVSYTLADGTARLVYPPKALNETDRYLSLWVYGDGSGNTLSAAFQDTDGNALSQSLGTLSFTGWKNLTAPVPDGAAVFSGLTLIGDKVTGTLRLDQITLSNQKTWDTTPPAVSLTVTGTTARATVRENTSSPIAKEQLSLTVDGTPVPFTWDAAGKTLTATLSDLTPTLHQVTVTAADPCGNRSRSSVTTSGSSAANPFADMPRHWALPYTIRLNELGIVTGSSAGGKTYFHPDRAITRGDFALMTARWMGLDLNDYQSVKLPYADAASIPAWDAPAVKALYALGIMQGSRDAAGALQSHATAPITRAEAMTILGRTQAKGFRPASLSSFSDQRSVPGWARDHVAVLVEMGVVSGSGGQLRPNASVTRAEVAKLLVALW